MSLKTVEPTSPFPLNFDADFTINSDQDQKVSKASKPRFPRLKAGLVSLKDRIAAQINRRNAYLLSLFLAAYPIAKLMLSIIAYFATGAAIALPPVAFGLLIAATTLFLIATLVTIHKKREELDGKEIAINTLTSIFIFALAPITAPIFGIGVLYHLAKKAKVKIEEYRSAPVAAKARVQTKKAD